MNSNPKLACAIAAILGGSALGTGAARAQEDTGGAQLEEVTVTAQRRAENIQNVPITIQAVTGDQLQQLSISNLDDAIRFLPNVSLASNGPGAGNIFMRGLSPGSAGNQSQASIASFPNVAVYLDDQSVQFPGRNLDILAEDLERIEVLEGPQGTLFGGGAQAGALRYITNKPKLDRTEGNVKGSYGVTAGGDPNSTASAVLNVPLIQDKLAVRALVYTERRGGYIDNVPSTFTRQNTDNGAFRLGVNAGPGGTCPNGLPAGAASAASPNGVCVPLGLPVVNNLGVVEDNQNSVDYTGLRVSGLYQFTDDWSLLVAQSYQRLQSDGVFAQLPIGSDGQALGDLKTTSFAPAYLNDKFSNTSWTLNGEFANLKAVYTGGYLTRTTNQANDYTNYARGNYGIYYQCTGGAATGATTNGAGQAQAPKCYTPASNWNDLTRNTHITHELRFSSPDEYRLRGLAGAFYENFKIFDDMNFNYKSVPSCTPANLAASNAGGDPCVGNVGPLAGGTAKFPDVRGDTTAFGEDLQRGYKQTAFFVSADFDLIPKVLTLSAGTRRYSYKEGETGSVYYSSTSCANVPNGCPAGTNLDAIGLKKTYKGFRSRVNLTWHVTDDVLAYGTFSQGFRPGGFNRESGTAGVAKDAAGVNQLFKPSSYKPDTLNNYEVGLKAEFFDRRLQTNLSAYHMVWKDVQLALFNPNQLGNTTFVTNGPDYKIDGFELQINARVTEGFSVQGSGSYNDSKQKNDPCLISNNPAAAAFGGCITEVRNSAGVVVPLTAPFGPKGGSLAFSPKVQFNLRGRYDWAFNDFKAFFMAGASYVDKMFNQTDNGTTGFVGNPFTTLLRYKQPGYSTFDASLGVAKDAWTAELFGTNLGNKNASVFTSSAQYIRSEVPIRPRVLGLRIGFKF